jgi:hypothetical protein
MPGVQHLIDFVLNEVALCGNQGVYSLFTGTHFSSPRRRMSCRIVDFKRHRNHVKKAP